MLSCTLARVVGLITSCYIARIPWIQSFYILCFSRKYGKELKIISYSNMASI